MVKQDVATMLDALWQIIDENGTGTDVIQIPPVATTT